MEKELSKGRPNTWCYVPVKLTDGTGYELREAYRDDAGELSSITSKAVTMFGDTVEELAEALEMALRDVRNRTPVNEEDFSD